LQVSQLYAQKTIHTDSIYLAILKIKNDSARNVESLNYTVSLIIRKNPMGAALGDVLMKQAIQAKDDKLLARVYGAIGGGYLRTGDYAIAYPYLIKALAIYQKVDDPVRHVRVYQNMAWIQIQLKDDAAETSLQDAIKITQARNLKGQESEVLGLLGVYYDSHLNFDKAIAAYKRSLTLGDKYGNKYSQASAYTNLSIALRRTKRYKEAFDNLLIAKRLATEVNDKYLMQSADQNLAELTLEMKDYNGAEKYILLALNNSKDNFEAVTRRGLFENLKNVYDKKGEYKKALQYSDSIIKLDQSVFDKDKVADIRDLQIKYQTAIKDQKILQQKAENQQEKQLLIIGQKQTQIQKLSFANKQKQFETDRKLQASLLQKNKLQGRLDKQLSSAQIFKQNETIKINKRLEAFLLIILTAALIIAALIFYNQRKTKQLNKVIVSQKNDLEDLNAVKDRMFSIIGHDMRSPINTLIAFTHLLEGEQVSDDNLRLYAAEIKKTLGSTAAMMNNLLNWANSQMRGYSPTFETYQLNAIANQVVSEVEPQAAQKGITINNNILPDINIFTDNNMAELILRNLITNAIKFTPQNGAITLTAEQSAAKTSFSVSDNGVGMSTDQVVLFNSKKIDYTVNSTRGTNKEKGTGLGLLLCKTFVELMDGSITLKSQPGQGSTFAVSLNAAIAV
jgi:signal transduction histidine kinase